MEKQKIKVFIADSNNNASLKDDSMIVEFVNNHLLATKNHLPLFYDTTYNNKLLSEILRIIKFDKKHSIYPEAFWGSLTEHEIKKQKDKDIALMDIIMYYGDYCIKMHWFLKNTYPNKLLNFNFDAVKYSVNVYNIFLEAQQTYLNTLLLFQDLQVLSKHHLYGTTFLFVSLIEAFLRETLKDKIVNYYYKKLNYKDKQKYYQLYHGEIPEAPTIAYQKIIDIIYANHLINKEEKELFYTLFEVKNSASLHNIISSPIFSKFFNKTACRFILLLFDELDIRNKISHLKNSNHDYYSIGFTAILYHILELLACNAFDSKIME